MAVSNFRGSAYLEYLTVFRSRLGSLNLVSSRSEFQAQDRARLERLVRRDVERRQVVRTDESPMLLAFLREKEYLLPCPRTTDRYQGLCLGKSEDGKLTVHRRGATAAAFEAYVVDVWMADPRVRSTVAVPTTANIDELIDMAIDFGTLNRRKLTLAGPGQLARALRGDAIENPYVIALDGIAWLSEWLEADHLILEPLLQFLSERVGSLIRRDEVSLELPTFAAAGLEAAVSEGFSPERLRPLRLFAKQLQDTRAKRGKQTRAPGVLEHRTTPRLEWLTDLRALSKEGRSRNGFEYVVTEHARHLAAKVQECRGRPVGWSDAAVSYWRTVEKATNTKATSPLQDLVHGYHISRRAVGPAPIRDVCVAAAATSRGPLLPSEYVVELTRIAATTKEVSLSGGRFVRSPEFVYMTESFLAGERNE